jgi:hypothetical protein
METLVVRKAYSCDHLMREWGAGAWKNPPCLVITSTFPGGILFGAKGSGRAEHVSFFLLADDALIIGQRLIAAARQAGAV